MSDTPRTDEAKRSREWWATCYEGDVFLVEAKESEKLERELAASLADKERLDFYQRYPARVRFVFPFWYSIGVSNGEVQRATKQWHSFREAIDAARQQEGM